MLIAKAGRDQFPDINASIDRFAGEAPRAGAEVTVLTHPRGDHGFDIANHNARSREIISRTLAFLRGRLAAETARSWAGSSTEAARFRG